MAAMRGLPAGAGDDPRPASASSQRRILVVDDHRDAARILALLLESQGHEVRTVTDGARVIEAVQDFKPSVVFLDIGLPQVDGYELARRVRELPGGRDLRLVALTGWGHAEARERSRQAGFDDHLVKPAAAKALRDLLEH